MTRSIVLLMALTAACGDNLYEPVTGTWVQYTAAPPLCDGVTNDRASIQAMLNLGGTVQLPPGECLIAAPNAGSTADLVLPVCPAGAHYELVGAGEAGTVLRQAPGQPPSARTLHVAGSCWTIRDLTLDGAAQDQPLCALVKNGITSQVACEHRAGVFAAAAVTIQHVTARDFSGDGFSLYTGSGSIVDHVTAVANLRDGLSCIGTAGAARITNSLFAGNAAEQVDLEPASCPDVELRDNVLDGQGVNDFALAIAHGDRFLAVDNVINGPVDIVHSHSVRLEHNAITNQTLSSAVIVYLDSDAELRSNTIVSPVSRIVVEITGLAAAMAQPSVRLAGNTLTGTGQTAIVYAQGANSVETSSAGAGTNTLTCTGPSGLGVGLRATLAAPYTFARAELRGDMISGCTRGLELNGNYTAQLAELYAGDDDWGGGTVKLDDGNGPLRFAVVSGMTVSRWPAGAVLTAAWPLTVMTR